MSRDTVDRCLRDIVGDRGVALLLRKCAQIVIELIIDAALGSRGSHYA